MRVRLLVLGALALTMAGCAGCGGGGGGKKSLTGGGSSFVDPMMQKWANAYKEKTGVLVDYNSIGSVEGVARMNEGLNVFGCTDAPMDEEQTKRAGGADQVVHVPLVMGAVVPIYNLSGIKDLKLTGKVLADIYLGNVKKWNDDAIRNLNRGVDLPDKDIAVVRRSDGSGTSYVFTDYLSQVSPQWKDKVGKQTNPNWPAAAKQGEPKNSGVAKAVSSTEGAIGYVELLFAIKEKGLQIALVENKSGKYVPASVQSVEKAAEKTEKFPDDLKFSIVNPPGDDVYPISGTVWAVCKVNVPNNQGKDLAAFLHWCLTDGQQLAEPMHYARLPDKLVELARKKIDQIK